MTKSRPTIAVRLTAPGRGAVATILVSGPLSLPAVASQFRPAGSPPLAERPLDQIAFGRWGGPEGEEVVACRRAAEQIEIHCHGGQAAARAILRDLCEAGCQENSWQSWIQQTEEGPLRAAARLALTQCRTQRTAGILLDQYQGSLDTAIRQVIQAIEQSDQIAAQQLLDTLLGWAEFGRHLVNPWRVVLAGPPNVGKSSLINALVGYHRAIVYDQPGSTRDAVSAETAIDGWPVQFTDTAGLRTKAVELEAAGIAHTQANVATAHLVILVRDAREEHAEWDHGLDSLPERVLRVSNKCDLTDSLVQTESLAVSALTGQGIAELLEQIGSRLVPRTPLPGEAVLFEHSQGKALEQAVGMLNKRRFSDATRLLKRFVTTAQTPDLINEV